MSHHSLVVDTGHTRIKLASCRHDEGSPLPRAVESMAVLYDSPVPWEAVKNWFVEAPPDFVVLSGTNSLRAEALYRNWPEILPSPRLLLEKRRIPINVEVDFPEKVGVDRLLNGVAANRIRQPGQPVIIIDTGTAITVDVVDAQGTFQGGAILPGILMGAKSLHETTTTLPHVDVWQLLKTEPDVLGKNTEAAIASGLYWGHLGAVKELLNRYTEWLQPSTLPPLLLLTGGAAGILAPYLSNSQHEPDLSLQGLALSAGVLQD